MASGIDSITISSPGTEPLTMTGDEWDHVVNTITAPKQLTFDVGAANIARPAESSINISGKGTLRSELRLLDEVIVQIVNGDGEVIASYGGEVADVGFKKHDETETTAGYIERIHKVKLGDRQD